MLQLTRRLGLLSPWCLSSACHYLDPEHFHGEAAELVAAADRQSRIYCFERESGEVSAALRWEPTGWGTHRIGAITLRGGEGGALRGPGAEAVHAAAIFALGVIRYREHAAGASGELEVVHDTPGGYSPDLRALGFEPGAIAWHLPKPRTRLRRLGSWLALKRLRIVTRR